MQSIYNYFFLTKLSKVISFYEIALHKSQYRLEPESHPRALPDQNIEWHHQVTTTTKFESEGLYSTNPAIAIWQPWPSSPSLSLPLFLLFPSRRCLTGVFSIDAFMPSGMAALLSRTGRTCEHGQRQRKPATIFKTKFFFLNETTTFLEALRSLFRAP